MLGDTIKIQKIKDNWKSILGAGYLLRFPVCGSPQNNGKSDTVKKYENQTPETFSVPDDDDADNGMVTQISRFASRLAGGGLKKQTWIKTTRFSRGWSMALQLVWNRNTRVCAMHSQMLTFQIEIFKATDVLAKRFPCNLPLFPEWPKLVLFYQKELRTAGLPSIVVYFWKQSVLGLTSSRLDLILNPAPQVSAAVKRIKCHVRNGN